MRTLDQIKQEVAERDYHLDYNELHLHSLSEEQLNDFIKDIATMYAEEALDEVVDKVKMVEVSEDSINYSTTVLLWEEISSRVGTIKKTVRVDKGSILNVKQQLK